MEAPFLKSTLRQGSGRRRLIGYKSILPAVAPAWCRSLAVLTQCATRLRSLAIFYRVAAINCQSG